MNTTTENPRLFRRERRHSKPRAILTVAFCLSAALAPLMAGPPIIQPSTSLQHRVVQLGKSASLAVSVSGDAPLAVQWRLDGQPLPNQTNRTFMLSAVQAADEGDYTVVVSNSQGTATSEPARLWVVPAVTNLVRLNLTNSAGLRLPYFISMPVNYDPARSYPLVAFLTGGHAGEDVFPGFAGDNPVTRVLASYKQQQVDPVIFVWPCRRAGDDSWTEQYRRQVMDLLDRLISQFNIDTNRVYVGGISGGTGLAWDVIGARPGFFAAGSMMSGGRGATPAAILNSLPFWAGCASDDEAGNLAPTQAAVLALRSAGARVIYTEYRSGGHIGGCTMLASTPAWAEWLLAQRRGHESVTEPLVSINSPAAESTLVTGGARLSLAGSARARGQAVLRASWQNLANKTTGTALGTNLWSISDIPLAPDATNTVVVMATTTSWAPAYGGNTSFNETLLVFCSPIRATLLPNGVDVLLNWTGGGPPYRIQRAISLAAAEWTEVLSYATPPVALSRTNGAGFFRIVGH